MIQVEGLTKRYRETAALLHLSLLVPPGSVFGLLGPNGAGKTTFLRLVMGLILPDEGRIDRSGLPPACIGYLPERSFYPVRFTLQEYLTTVARLAGLKGEPLRDAVRHLLERVGLGQVATRRIGSCSRGMLQRLGLAQAMLGEPRLLLLDEPALGLDPAGQKMMRDQIVSLHQAGTTVLLSSHHLDEVTRVCTHVGVLNRGRLVTGGALQDVLPPRPRVEIRTTHLSEDLLCRLRSLVPHILATPGGLTLSGQDVAHKAEVLRLLLDSGADIRQLSQQHATLEEVYLEAIGEWNAPEP